MATSIEVLTLNCWGLKYISAHRHARLSEIGHQLATRSPAPDVVGLQECWTQADYLAIRDHTRHILPYGKFYYGGIFGAGLVILSRWPIIESNMVAYPLNGRPTAFFRGDWFVGKGVACAKIKYGQWDHDVMEVFCTHVCHPRSSIVLSSYFFPCHSRNAGKEDALFIYMCMYSYMPPTNKSLAILISVTAPRRRGKLRNSCATPSNAVISLSLWAISI